MFELGTQINQNKKTNPAIFVTANLQGNRHYTSEASLYLIEKIFTNKKMLDSLTYYIVPCANPDAADLYFQNPYYSSNTNATPVNDDLDEQTDEDGYEDLNKDGLITMMRVKNPEGKWVVSDKDKRLMKKANAEKGERGVYHIYTEGIDNDLDGQYNEDLLGGNTIYSNFPHRFEHFKRPNSLFPLSETETYSIVKFIYNHSDIIMTITFGETNFCKQIPKTAKKGKINYNKIKLSKEQAENIKQDPNKKYTYKELLDLVKNYFGNEEVHTRWGYSFKKYTQYLPDDEAVEFLNEDIDNYKFIKSEYEKYQKSKNINEKRIKPNQAKNGSFELWSYFQLGIHTYSLDFWSLPIQKNDTSNKKVEKKKIEEKSFEENYLAYIDKYKLKEKYIEWKPFKHNQLGNVEIGGFVVGYDLNPPYQMLDSVFEQKIPWVFQLISYIPTIKFLKYETKKLGTNIYRLQVWVSNNSPLPYPTTMGILNQTPPPIVVGFKDDIELIDGLKNTPIQYINGNSVQKINWIIKTKSNKEITLKLNSDNCGNDELKIKF